MAGYKAKQRSYEEALNKNLEYDKKEKEEGLDDIIWADPFRTKDLIWDAYYGFKFHYVNFLMNKFRGKMKVESRLGLYKYALALLMETFCLLPKFGSVEEKADLPKFLNSLQSGKELLDNDFNMIWLHTNNLLVRSGMKDITKIEDNRDPLLKQRW